MGGGGGAQKDWACDAAQSNALAEGWDPGGGGAGGWYSDLCKRPDAEGEDEKGVGGPRLGGNQGCALRGQEAQGRRGRAQGRSAAVGGGQNLEVVQYPLFLARDKDDC